MLKKIPIICECIWLRISSEHGQELRREKLKKTMSVKKKIWTELVSLLSKLVSAKFSEKKEGKEMIKTKIEGK